ncbi:MAG: iron-containing alcohol dehydrogenase [Clostridiales bacterium]|nr:iron-containing alcohol dehydrogenase [Clostridiales bacterium]
MMMTHERTELAEQGMDLLAHAFELCQDKQAKGYGDGLAQSVVQVIFRDLPAACGDEPDSAATESMKRAQILIGSFIRQPAQDICHSLSASVSAEFSLPHGKVNAIILPAMLNYLVTTCSASDRRDDSNIACIHCYAKLARVIGLTVTDDLDAIAKLALAVRKLRAQVGLPRSIAEFLVDESVYRQAVPVMAKRAWLGIGTRPGRPRPSVRDIEQILQDAF